MNGKGLDDLIGEDGEQPDNRKPQALFLGL